MNVHLAEVLQAVGRLADLHEELISIARRMREAIAADDVGTVSALTRQEEKIARSIAEWDDVRIRATAAYMASMGIAVVPSSFTVEQLVRFMSRAEDKQALMREAERLGKAVAQFKELHDLNMQLVRQALAFVQYSLDVLAGSHAEEATYAPPDRSASVQAARRTFFDTRA